MPRIVRTKYGGVWPSASAESDSTIYAQDAVDADVSNFSLRPMRAPRQIAVETGRSLFFDGCTLLLGDATTYYAHNSVGGDVVYRTGVNGYPEVAYSFAPPPPDTGNKLKLNGIPPTPVPPPPPAPPPPPRPPTNFELREDNTYELREDGSFELRE